MELYQFAVLAVVVGYFVFLMWLVITSKQKSPY